MTLGKNGPRSERHPQPEVTVQQVTVNRRASSVTRRARPCRLNRMKLELARRDTLAAPDAAMRSGERHLEVFSATTTPADCSKWTPGRTRNQGSTGVRRLATDPQKIPSLRKVVPAALRSPPHVRDHCLPVDVAQRRLSASGRLLRRIEKIFWSIQNE